VAATRLLENHGWRMPPSDAFPTGAELVEGYLKPLAATRELATVIETGARVEAISRHGMDKVVSHGRANKPFELSIATGAGRRRDFARAVIDASGTWTNPIVLSSAVALGALVGPSQVSARAIEMAIGRYHHPIGTKLASVSLLAAGLAGLWFGSL
jgi:hypothetical protein